MKKDIMVEDLGGNLGNHCNASVRHEFNESADKRVRDKIKLRSKLSINGPTI